MDLTASLENTALLAGLSADTYAELARLSRRLRFEEGDTVYRIGDPALDVLIVLEGRVRFTIGVGNRPESGGSVFGTGDALGWAALIEDQPRRIATAVCMEDSTLIALNGEQLLGVFERDTKAGYLVMRRLAKMIANDFIEQSAALNSA
jgi:toluene monooxygenase system ferredoxin subunit